MQSLNSIRLIITLIVLFTVASCHQQQQSSSNNPDPAHNSQLSVDWPGTYTGMLPCANCDGIAVTLHLNEDETYEILMTYEGRTDNNTFTSSGQFTWDEQGSIIRLEGFEGESQYFQVGENQLFQLDTDKQRIKGALAEMYILKKKMLNEEEALLHGKYWKLKELDGNTIIESPEQMRSAHLKLDLLKMRAYGSGSCNNFFGGFLIPSAGKIKFKPMASTLMACPDMETDRRLFSVFERTDAYTIEGETLNLYSGEQLVAVFTAEAE